MKYMLFMINSEWCTENSNNHIIVSLLHLLIKVYLDSVFGLFVSLIQGHVSVFPVLPKACKRNLL